MNEDMLNLLGLMRKANAIEIGEDNTADAVHAGKAKLLLLASDASENAKERATRISAGRNVQLVPLPFTKNEISAHVGCAGCSMSAVTDIGFANAFMKTLALRCPSEYAESAQETENRFDKVQRRKQEKRADEKKKQIGKRRNNI